MPPLSLHPETLRASPRVVTDGDPLSHSRERAADRLYAHLAWTTLGRLPLLRGRPQAAAEGHLIALSRRLDLEPLCAIVLPDRVHLVVRFRPGHALGAAAAALKEGTARSLVEAGFPVRWGRDFAATTLGPREVRETMRTIVRLADRFECSARAKRSVDGPPSRG